jgi:hypothetical protein
MTMKRITGFLALFVFIFSCGIDPVAPKGLTFILVGADSVSIQTGETAVYRVKVKNNGPDTVVITAILKKISVNPDTSWQITFCAGDFCVAPGIYSTDAGLPPGESECAVDITPMHGTAGPAIVEFQLFCKDDPARKYEYTFVCAVQ